MLKNSRFLLCLAMLCALNVVSVQAGEAFVGKSYSARDTLAPQAEESPDAKACLAGLCW